MSEQRIDPDLLPFSLEKQRATLGYILHDDKFFSSVVGKLEGDWFADEVLGKIYSALKKWFLAWGRKPTLPELTECPDIRSLNSKVLVQVRATLPLLEHARKNYDHRPLLSEMETWLKARTIQAALPKAANAFNAQKLDESMIIMNQMVRDYNEIDFSDGAGCLSFLDYGQELERQEQDSTKGLTFGLAAMDRILEPEGLAGGLMPGQMTVLLAPTNVGKTSVMVTVAVANILRGKSVCFIFHEGTEDELKNKFMRCISGMTTSEMRRAYLDPEQAQKMRNYELILTRFLVLKPMYQAALKVEEVALAFERLQDLRRMECGSGFDLLVDDYAAKLTCAANSKGNMQPRQEQENVYNQFVQMGLRHKVHVLTAIQTNREGSKVNRKVGDRKHETRLLHVEDVAETWGAMTAAAIVISLNRSDQDQELGKITFLLCKSRSGETGWAVVCNSNYDICRTHSNDAGHFRYRGTQSVGKKSEQLMDAYKNQVVGSKELDLFEA
jgi:replicative DNA helicase